MDLTQQDLAGKVGCSAETIAKIEAGERKPSKQVAERLADCLSIPSEEHPAFVRFARTDPATGQPGTLIPTDERAPWRALQNRHQMRHANNLTAPPNPFVGREKQTAGAVNLLRRHGVRLLTMTGPPGIGKTRLALQVATELLSDFDAGVYFVALASISDPRLVISTIAQTLDVRESGRRPLLDSLKNYLRDKRMLLVLDNFEQVLQSAASVAELFSVAPLLKVLVTSRVPLHIYGEYRLKIPPMQLPDQRRVTSIAMLAECEAIELFIERAIAANPNFTLTPDNAPAVVEICRLLDGLPLAIELAAARIEFLSPNVMLERLQSREGRLKLLTGGPTNLPARQRTLRNAITWSYSLLDPDEQKLFSRLSVFVGGCTVEATQVVCGETDFVVSEEIESDLRGSRLEMAESLRSLADKSLLQQEESSRPEGKEYDTGPQEDKEERKEADEERAQNNKIRFKMLETVREYAWERLVESEEAGIIAQRHASYYLALAEQAEPEIRGPNQATWLDRLESERDNLRAALRWASDNSEAEIGLRLGGALGWFWFRRGHLSEGRARLAEALTRTEELYAKSDAHPIQARAWEQAQAKALIALGRLADHQGDYAAARRHYEQSRLLYQELVNEQGVGYALCGLGFTTFREGDKNNAKQLYEQALELFRELNDKRGIATAIRGLGDLALHGADYSTARTLYAESLALFQELGDKYIVATLLNGLGNVALDQGDYSSAHFLYEESLAIFRELGDKYGIAGSLLSLAEAARCEEDYTTACALNEESLAIWKEWGEKWNAAMTLHNLGHSLHHNGDLRRAGASFAEGLVLFREAGAKAGIGMCFAGLAGVAGAWGGTQPERAARLFGVAEVLFDATATTLQAADLADYRHNLTAARSQLDEAAWEAAWEVGQSMTTEQAIAYALDGSS